MNEQIAKELLKTAITNKDNRLYCCGWYLGWIPKDKQATLDGEFTADELEAIVWWMRNKGE